MTFKLRLPLALVAGLFLSGCAITDEFSRRGGFTDRILDEVLFAAETKEHRVFRSYLLVGILARIGSESPVNLDDREAVGFRIAQAVQAGKEALICAKDPDCAFFEDRQAILDRRLFRLAVAVLYPEETRDFLAKVRQGLQGKLPVAGRAVAVASAAVEIAGEAGGAVNEVAGVVNSLMDLGFTATQYSQRLGPLYRDSIQLDMSIFKKSLETQLAVRKLKCAERENNPTQSLNICALLGQVASVHDNGTGSIWAWRNFLNGEVRPYAYLMVPQKDHWVQASDLISRGCMLLLKDDKVKMCRPENSLIHQSALASMIERQKGIEDRLN